MGHGSSKRDDDYKALDDSKPATITRANAMSKTSKTLLMDISVPLYSIFPSENKSVEINMLGIDLKEGDPIKIHLVKPDGVKTWVCCVVGSLKDTLWIIIHHAINVSRVRGAVWLFDKMRYWPPEIYDVVEEICAHNSEIDLDKLSRLTEEDSVDAFVCITRIPRDIVLRSMVHFNKICGQAKALKILNYYYTGYKKMIMNGHYGGIKATAAEEANPSYCIDEAIFSTTKEALFLEEASINPFASTEGKRLEFIETSYCKITSITRLTDFEARNLLSIDLDRLSPQQLKWLNYLSSKQSKATTASTVEIVK
jgi:hypothetical protein